jgi:D-alanine-D-alanine ligase
MDKAMAKEIAASGGIAQADHATLNAADELGDADALLARLGGSVFVKPANLGSSVGVSRADTADELRAACDLAFTYDERVVVEERIEGREIECAVLGHTDDPRASVPGEAIPGAVYRHYSDKYLDGIARMIVPAELDEDVVAAVQSEAVRVFTTYRCEGMARVDFFLTDTGFVLNEINTMPGFTPISMFPRCWQETGLAYSDLITELIEVALAHRG